MDIDSIWDRFDSVSLTGLEFAIQNMLTEFTKILLHLPFNAGVKGMYHHVYTDYFLHIFI